MSSTGSWVVFLTVSKMKATIARRRQAGETVKIRRGSYQLPRSIAEDCQERLE